DDRVRQNIDRHDDADLITAPLRHGTEKHHRAINKNKHDTRVYNYCVSHGWNPKK
ncbi:unnamed protein product, partial [Amoebophrya sp. A25]